MLDGTKKDNVSFLSLVPYCVLQELLMPILKEAEHKVITDVLLKNARAKEWERTEGYTRHMTRKRRGDLGEWNYSLVHYDYDINSDGVVKHKGKESSAMNLVNDEEIVKRETARIEGVFGFLWEMHIVK